MLRHASVSWVALSLGGALAVAACEEKPAESQAPATPASAASAKASAATTASAKPAATTLELPVYAAKKVPEGSNDKTSPWTLAFEVERKAGNVGLAYEAAQKSCNDAGKWLCSEAQWERACKHDAALGKIETWTTTGVGGERFVVRGGEGCSSRSVKPKADESASRGAVCCERAVAIDTDNRNLAFLRASALKLREYEKALQERDTAALSSVYDDKVAFLGKEYSKSGLISQHRKDLKKFPKQWTFFDGCTVKIGKDGEEAVLVSDCRAVFQRAGKVRVGVQRLVRGGPKGLIQQIGNTSLKKTDAKAQIFAGFEGEPETKERVGVLLLSE